MKKIIFDVSDDMFTKIDTATIQEGFMSRSEFLRFLIVTYFKKNQAPSSSVENDADMTHGTVKNNDEVIGLAFGIPPHVIKEIEEAKQRLENERRRRS